MGLMWTLLIWKGDNFLVVEVLASGKLSISLNVVDLASFLEILSTCEYRVNMTLLFKIFGFSEWFCHGPCRIIVYHREGL